MMEIIFSLAVICAAIVTLDRQFHYRAAKSERRNDVSTYKLAVEEKANFATREIPARSCTWLFGDDGKDSPWYDEAINERAWHK